MDKIFAQLLKSRFYLILLILSILLFYISLFKDVPIASNNFTPTLREESIKILLFTSLFFLVVAITQSIFIEVIFPFKKNRTEDNSTSKVKTDKGVEDSIQAPIEVEYENKKDIDLINSFLSLTNTQKTIIKEIYRGHRGEYPCDELQRIFNKKNSDEAIESHSEFIYRIKDLDNSGLIETKKVGERTTVVIIIPEVQKKLEDNNLINS